MIETNAKKITTAQRRQQIVQQVNLYGSVTSEVLADQFAVSHMTIWRDLKALEEDGLLIRVHGGALPVDNGRDEPLFTGKLRVNQAQKECIAQYAAENLVFDNDNIIIEGGTTAAAMVKYLRQQNLTVMTNGLAVINEAAPALPDFTVMACGGILRDVSYTFVGPQAEQFFRGMRVHRLFLGATGLSPSGLVTDPNLLEIQMKQAMVACADEVILLMDSSKFGVRSLAELVALTAVSTLITDAQPPAELTAVLQAENVALIVVD